MSLRLSRALSTLACVTLAAAAARADTLHVPGDAATVQGAVVLAASGDTILVAPGTWVEHVDFLGKQLVVQSDGGAAVTTLDGAGTGPVVRLASAEPEGTTLRGFTITGGATGEPVGPGAPFPDDVMGGGLFLGGGAHLDLHDCVVTGNLLTGAATQGGGVAVRDATLLLRECTLSLNSADQGSALSVWDGASVKVVDCTVSGNLPGHGTVGSAIYAGLSFRATNCRVVDNQLHGLQAFGTGPWAGCTFEGNTGLGAIIDANHGVDVRDCEFLGNGQGALSVWGLTVVGAEHFVRRCVFADDPIDVAGGLAHFDACTFDGADVTVSSASGGPTPLVLVTNSIARAAKLAASGISYSDVEGFVGGTGNIDADPQWVNPAAHDYGLQPTSPCLDAADPAVPLDANLTRADMGAVPLDAWHDLGGRQEWGSPFGQAPRLVGQGQLLAGATVGLALSEAPPLKPTILFVGLDEAGLAFKGGVLWPSFDLVVPGLLADGGGRLWVAGTLPSGVPSGTTLIAQFALKHPGAPDGVSLSNGVRVTAP